MLEAAPLLVAPQHLGPALALSLVPGPLVRLLPPFPFSQTPGFLRGQALPHMQAVCKQSIETSFGNLPFAKTSHKEAGWSVACEWCGDAWRGVWLDSSSRCSTIASRGGKQG